MLKPIQQARLKQELEKYSKLRQVFNAEENASMLTELLKNVRKETSVFQGRFLVSKSDSLIPDFINEVAYF